MPALWSRHATLALAERARRFQREAELRWRVLLSDHPTHPFELHLYRFTEEAPPMGTTKLSPGPLRDALAAASEHTRGGEPFTFRELQARLGLPPTVAMDRLAAMESSGWIRATSEVAPIPYEITEHGRSLL